MKTKMIFGFVLMLGLVFFGCATDIQETYQDDYYEEYSQEPETVPYTPTTHSVESLASMCESYYSPGSIRDGCYAMTAIDNNVPELCEKMTTETEEMIILCMAEASGDLSYCEQLSSGSYEHYKCYSHMAELYNDASLCDNIDETPTWKNVCLIPFR